MSVVRLDYKESLLTVHGARSALSGASSVLRGALRTVEVSIRFVIHAGMKKTYSLARRWMVG
jgi:hypothetical protein